MPIDPDLAAEVAYFRARCRLMVDFFAAKDSGFTFGDQIRAVIDSAVAAADARRLRSIRRDLVEMSQGLMPEDRAALRALLDSHASQNPFDEDESPERVVLDGFPPGAVRVVASRQSGDVAYVLLDSHPEGWRYLYGVNCERVDGWWNECGSGNGAGWSEIGPKASLGTLVLWNEVSRDADRARAVFEGQMVETVVDDGMYLFVWWNVPCPEDEWPRLEGLRIRGEWVRVASTRPN